MQSVAPSSFAISNLAGLVSTTTMRPAFAITAPCTTDRPMPPMPNTATDAPGSTFAVFSTAPMPVVMPQPSRHTFSSGAALLIFATEISGSTPRPWVTRIFWHRLVLPERQYAHSPHSGVYSGITWSPTCSEVTPSPTSSTMPPPSCPRITGNIPSGSAPDNVNASVWQTPVATMRSSTSPAFGPATSTCSIDNGLPASQATAARDFMIQLLSLGGRRALSCNLMPSVPHGPMVAKPHLPTVVVRLGQQPFAEQLQAAMFLRAWRIHQPIRFLYRQIVFAQHLQPPGVDQRLRRHHPPQRHAEAFQRRVAQRVEAVELRHVALRRRAAGTREPVAPARGGTRLPEQRPARQVVRIDALHPRH